MSNSLSPISSMAWSHLMRVHWPLLSFIGYFSRRSPLTSSRTEAPLAQCEPRLMGLFQLGSWPIQTPFATSAVTVQPTEQWVQMLLRMVTCAPAGGGGPALGLRPQAAGRRPRGRGRPGFGLAHRAERERAERRQAAGGEAGAAQETAAVEAAVDLSWQGAGKHAAPGLTVRPFDQHGCLLISLDND